MVKVPEEVISFPRSWSHGDHEYVMVGNVFDLRYAPEENIRSLNERLEHWESQFFLEDNERRRIRLADLAKRVKIKLDKVLQEDERRMQHCLNHDLDEKDFRRLLYLHENPNANRIESVYVIKQNGSDFYKIGVSKTPERRLNEVNTGNPHGGELIMYYTGTSPYEREKLLHEHFDEERFRPDAEWFELRRIDLVSIEKTFESWLEEDISIAEYLSLEVDELGINNGPFEKWDPNKFNKKSNLGAM